MKYCFLGVALSFVFTNSTFAQNPGPDSVQSPRPDSVQRLRRNYLGLGLALEEQAPNLFLEIEFHSAIGQKRRYFLGLNIKTNYKQKRSTEFGEHNDLSSSSVSLSQQFYFLKGNHQIVAPFINLNVGMRWVKQDVYNVYQYYILIVPAKATDDVYEKKQKSPDISFGCGLLFHVKDKFGISAALNVHRTKPFELYEEENSKKVFASLAICIQFGPGWDRPYKKLR